MLILFDHATADTHYLTDIYENVDNFINVWEVET